MYFCLHGLMHYISVLQQVLSCMSVCRFHPTPPPESNAPGPWPCIPQAFQKLHLDCSACPGATHSPLTGSPKLIIKPCPIPPTSLGGGPGDYGVVLGSMGSAVVELWGGPGEYGFMVIWIMGSRSGVGGRPIKKIDFRKNDNNYCFIIDFDDRSGATNIDKKIEFR